MKKLFAFLLSLCLVLSALPAAGAAENRLAEPSVVSTTVDYQTNPIGIAADDVKFSWAMESEALGASQLNYRIVVREGSESGEIVWDSGIVDDAHSTAVAYGGEALKQGVRYYWTVTITDQDGVEATSDVNFFEIAPDMSDATWLMYGKKNEAAPLFRTEVTLSGEVAKASLSLSSLGIYEAYINGDEVQFADGDDTFNPGMSDYNTNVTFQTYDVTDLLNKGANAIGVVVGGGWYQTSWGTSFNAVFGPDDTTTERAMLAKLVVTYTDGTQETFTSNTETWLASQSGPITYDDNWNGETYDMRIAAETADWAKVGYDVSDWETPGTDTYEGEVLADARSTAYINPTYEQKPVSAYTYNESETTEAYRVSDDEWCYGEVVEHPVDPDGDIELKAGDILILDMGQNMVGYNEITVSGPEGTTVVMRHAEYLNDGKDMDYKVDQGGSNGSTGSDGPKGTMYFTSLRSAKSTDTVILAGTGKEVYRPTFTFHGYRYVQITADQDITLHDLRGLVITSVGEETGMLETSNSDVNQLISNTKWSQMGNYLTIPTDCPQRNERCGWTGDAQLFAQTAVMNFDVTSFLERYVDHMNDYFESYGTYADVMPSGKRGTLPNSGWSDAGVIIPWVLYKQTGDVSIIEGAYSYMAQYTKNVAETGYNTWAYGDWLAPAPASLPFTSAAYELYINEIMTDMAELMGNDADAQIFAARAETVRQAMIEKYIDEDGNLLTATADAKADGSAPTVGFFPAITCIDNAQTGILWALKLGVYDSEETRQALIKNLLINIHNEDQSIRADGAEDSLSVGFLGVNVLLPVLTDSGKSETAYTLLLQDQNPSWLYSVKQGATTIWERWDAYNLDTSFGTSSMNSFNHYSYGACLEWMYNYMSGIMGDETDPGYKHFILQPTLDTQGRITYVNGSYKSLYGNIVSNWTSEDGALATYDAAVPANSSATLYLPVSGKTLNVSADLAAYVNVIGETEHNGENAIEIELLSGSYHFEVNGDSVDVTVTDGEAVSTGVEVALSGAAEITADKAELTYNVSVKDAIKLATVTLTFDVGNLENPVVEGADKDWYVISQTVSDGKLTAVMLNSNSVTTSEATDIAVLKADVPSQVGDVTVRLESAVLSAYVGDSEAFINSLITTDAVTTHVDYSIYDVNMDGVVDQLDITRAQRSFGKNKGDTGWNDRADVNGDGTVDIEDFIFILNNYTK